VSGWHWLLASAVVALVIYAVFVAALIMAGRKETARAVARFVPDCVVLFQRLLADPRVPRRKKLLLAALIPYPSLRHQGANAVAAVRQRPNNASRTGRNGRLRAGPLRASARSTS
jgi:hypothetical protein